MQYPDMVMWFYGLLLAVICSAKVLAVQTGFVMVALQFPPPWLLPHQPAPFYSKCSGRHSIQTLKLKK
jgi:hypothetical protein